MFVAARRAGAVFALAAALAVSGCSGSGSKPVSLPSISPSATSASPSPTSTAAQLARVASVVHMWFGLIDGATTLAAADAVDSITTSACKCRNVSRSMRDAVARHEHYVGTTRIASITPTIDGPVVADVLVEYGYTDGGLVDASGRYVSRESARRNVEADFRLVLVNGQWRIDIIENIRPGTSA